MISLPKTFGWKSCRLADHSYDDLNRLRESVVNNPANAMPASSLYLYTPAARRKLDALAWAVTYKLAERQKAAAA